MSVQFFRAEQPTSSLAAWACVVSPSVMQNAVLLGRNSRLRLNTRSYRSFPPRPSDQRVFGELTLSHHAPTDASAFEPDRLASGGGFHLRYDGIDRVTLSYEPQLLAVNVVRSNGVPALTGHISSKCCPSRTFLLKKILPLQGHRSSPSVARPTSSPVTVWEPPTPPLMRGPIAVFQSTNGAPAVSPPTNAHEGAAISELSLAAAAPTSSRPQCPARAFDSQTKGVVPARLAPPAKASARMSFRFTYPGVDHCGHRGN